MCAVTNRRIDAEETNLMAKLVVCPHEEPDGEICGFEARSDDEEALVSDVKQHAEEEHGLALSRGDVEQMMREE